MTVKRVCVFIPTLTAGGAERVVSELLHEWVSYEGVEVTLILFNALPIFYDVPVNVNLLDLKFDSKKKGLGKLFELIRLAFTFRHKIKRLKPDVLLSFMNKYNIFAIISLCYTNIKVVVSERDSPTEKFSRFRLILRDFCYKKANGLICQTSTYERYIKKRIPFLRTEVIANPVRFISDTDVKKENVILNVGRLEEKKGHRYLIDAVSMIKQDLLGWKVVIAGGGILQQKLKKRIYDNEIENIIELKGEVENVDELYLRSKIFAFTSLYEGFPNALAEAMVSGMACVSFDCPTGPSEIIEHNVNGELIELGNAKILAQRLKALVEDKELIRKYSNNSKLVIDKLNTKKITRQYFDFCLR